MNSAREQLRSVQSLGDHADDQVLLDLEADGEPETTDAPGVASRPGEGEPIAASEAQPHLMLPRIRVDAFVESEILVAAIGSVAKDRRAVRSEFAIVNGGFAEAIDHYRERAPADLVVIEDSGSVDQIEWRIEALAEFCPPSTRLVVVGERNDIVLYRRLIKLGVSDYLVQPVEPLTLLDSIASIFTEEGDTKNLGLVIAFVGARGGVGSSTVAQNAAAIFSRDFDATTLLIDADIGFGTVALQFDISSPHGLADALKEREDLNLEVLERLTHWRDKRFGILTAPDRSDQMTTPEPGMMRHVIDQARRLAKYVVLDLPHGWAPWTAEALAAADRVVLVATPDLPSLRNARTLLELIEKMRPNDEPAQLVLNRMPTRGKPAVLQEDFARILDRKVAATLPNDDAAGAAEMRGRVLAEDIPGSDVVSAIASLAARMAGREPFTRRKPVRKSLMSRMLSGGRQ